MYQPYAIINIVNVRSGMKKTVKCLKCNYVGVYEGCLCTYKCPICKTRGEAVVKG